MADVHLTFRGRGGARKKALAGVDLLFREPGVVGLVGPNGAGKTSLSRVLSGALAPDQGRFERPRRLLLMSRAYESKGFSPEHEWSYLRAMTNVDLPSLDDPRMDAVVGDRTVRELVRMGGRRRHLRAAAFLALGEPDTFVISDEELGAGDERWLKILAARAREKKAILVLISHDLAEIERFLDSVVLMRGGRIVEQGSAAELLSRYRKASSTTTEPAPRPARPSGARLARVEDVGLRQRRTRQRSGEKWRWLFRDLSREFHEGEVVRVKSKNGLTTKQFLRALVGAIRFDSGEYEADGRRVLLAGQPPGPKGFTVGEAIELYTELAADEERTLEIVDRVFGTPDPERLGQEVDTLSSGERLRLSAELCLSADPSMLLLSSNLRHGDEAFRRRFDADLVERTGAGLLVISAIPLLGLQSGTEVELGPRAD